MSGKRLGKGLDQFKELSTSLPSAAWTPSVRWALAGLSLSMLLSSLGTSIANVALPTLAQAFNASFQDVQWIVLAYLLAITTLIVSVGRLGDITGRRRLPLAGIILFTVASALAPRRSTLGSTRCARGAGPRSGHTMALYHGLVGETVPKTGRHAMGRSERCPRSARRSAHRWAAFRSPPRSGGRSSSVNVPLGLS